MKKVNQASLEIIARLRERGYRITDARVVIIDALATQTRPHTIAEFVDHVAVDETTVYRTMDMLLEEGVVERITDTHNENRFAIAHGHHHHLICTSCGHIEHLPCSSPEPKLKKHPFATITHHEVTFYGLCKPCHTSSKN